MLSTTTATCVLFRRQSLSGMFPDYRMKCEKIPRKPCEPVRTQYWLTAWLPSKGGNTSILIPRTRSKNAPMLKKLSQRYRGTFSAWLCEVMPVISAAVPVRAHPGSKVGRVAVREGVVHVYVAARAEDRSEEHTSELQSQR